MAVAYIENARESWCGVKQMRLNCLILLRNLWKENLVDYFISHETRVDTAYPRRIQLLLSVCRKNIIKCNSYFIISSIYILFYNL